MDILAAIKNEIDSKAVAALEYNYSDTKGHRNDKIIKISVLDYFGKVHHYSVWPARKPHTYYFKRYAWYAGMLVTKPDGWRELTVWDFVLQTKLGALNYANDIIKNLNSDYLVTAQYTDNPTHVGKLSDPELKEFEMFLQKQVTCDLVEGS